MKLRLVALVVGLILGSILCIWLSPKAPAKTSSPVASCVCPGPTLPKVTFGRHNDVFIDFDGIVVIYKNNVFAGIKQAPDHSHELMIKKGMQW